MRAQQKVLYLDMDNVLVDFPSGIARLEDHVRREYEDHLDDAPGIFALMDPMPGALDAARALAGAFDTYILSTAPWDNPSDFGQPGFEDWPAVTAYLLDRAESPQ